MAIVQKSHSSSQKYDTRNPPPAKPAATAGPSIEKIAARAYEIWQASGCPDGHDLEHWLQAERELRGSARSTSH